MNQFNTILKKLIKSGAGKTKFWIASVGLFIAILLLLTAVQLQINYGNLLNNKNNRDSIANFLVVNKVLTDSNLGNTMLDTALINNIRQQPFTNAVGLLTPSRFKASIQSSSDRFPFYTDISFESVPAEFIDVANEKWVWNEQSPFVPIIIPTMFLDIYNFQFSFSQNLPQLTPDVVKMIVFKLNLYAPNGTITLNGKIVGFSDRISSMMVPEEFMQWGNKQFSTTTKKEVSRLVIKTKDPGNPQLSAYLKQKNLTTDADKIRFSKYRKVVDTVVAISGITGLLMLLFALLIFTLFIQLTIASCKEEIILLITIGASPTQLSKFLMKQFFPQNIWIIASVLVVLSLVQYALNLFLIKQYIFVSPALSLYTFLIALLLIALFWLVNRNTIKAYIKQ